MITKERIGAYIDSLDTDLPEYLREIEEKALLNYVPIIKRPTRNLLRFLLRLERPQRVLEIGTAVGFSALLMSEVLPEGGTITTIEKIPKRILEAKKNIKAADKERTITLLEGDAKNVLSSLCEAGKSFDFIFMDAAKGQYLNFLPSVLKLLSTGGLLVSDNVLQDGDIVESRYAVTRRDRTIHSRMREYLYVLTHREDLDTVVLPLGDGVTLSTKL
jgi:predicted O-methyltransferase YrrM